MNLRLIARLKRVKVSQILQVGGTILVLTGLVVIFGWYTHQELLMRVLPNQVPMQYNTALLFIGCGLCLVLFGRGYSRLAAVPAGLVVIFSLMSLVQYLFNLDFGIDRLFFNPYITSGVQKPGRMAPNTALSFAFASLALLTMGLTFPKVSSRYLFLIVIFGSLTTALGAVAFLGYLTGISTAYGWGQQTRMAILTTFGMMTLGLAVVAWGWRQAQALHKMLPRWLPLLIFIAGLTVTICLWQAFLSEEGIALDHTTAQTLKTFQRDVTEGFKYRLLLLQEVAYHLEVTTAPEQTAWQQEVTQEINEFGGITALALTDSNLDNRKVITLGGNGVGPVLDPTQPLPVSEATRTALLAGKSQGHSAPLVIQTGADTRPGLPADQAGFIAFYPLEKGGVRNGFLLGIFQNQDFIKNILSKNSLSAYRLTITSSDQTVYSQDSQGGPPVSGSVQQSSANLGGITWKIQLEPGLQVQNSQQSLLPGLSLFGGILISALLAAITMLAQTSWRRARWVEETNLELVRSEELYTTLAGNLPESAVLLFDKDLTFTLAEGPILRNWGLDKREIQGKSISQVFPGEVIERLQAGFRKALQGEPSAFEYNNKPTVFSVQIFPVKNEPKKSFTGMVVFQDITERKRSEQLKTEFISTVSHELRTPLTSIQGSLGLVIGGVTGQLGPQTHTLLEIAHNNCARLVRLINDILDMEKIESGKMLSHKKPVELIPIIEQAIAANRAYAEQYRVSYHFEPISANIKVNADSDQLIQILNNLLSNAAKYSPTGGKVEIGVTLKASRVQVSVTDQGKGIPEEFKSRIFQKFSQADSSDTRQKGGTGLGLSIVKALLVQHDGEIAFTSKAGEGACFYFNLPVLAVEKSPGTPPGTFQELDQPRPTPALRL